MSAHRPPISVEEVLTKAVGLNVATIGHGSIDRAVARRMSNLGPIDREAYARRVAGSREELQKLFDELMITESWFFRDTTPFDLLRKRVAEGWLSDRARPPLRALSIPCASGEEPYSIAILLMESGLPRDRFRIDAVDFSFQALERARRGIYRPSTLREVPSAIRSRWFEHCGDRPCITPALRAAVRFHQGNLLEANGLAPWDSETYDIIFCRNLLIYFHEAARRSALATLERLLAPDGLLFVGHSEMSASQHPRLVPHPDRCAFAYWRDGGKAAGYPAPLPCAPPRVIVDPDASRSGWGPRDDEAPHRSLAPESPGGLLDRAETLANGKEYRGAISLCDRAIREGETTPRAYRLLATIHQASGGLIEAERAYLQAVYLDPNDDDALLALAMLARQRGDHVTSERYRKRAQRSWRRKGDS